MRYPGCAAGGMRRVRRNAAWKLNNGRCTSQISAMSSRRASGESCAIAASSWRRSSLSKAARSTSPGRRRSVLSGGAPFARAPRPMPEILGHRLLVVTASARYLGNRERVFWPKRLEHAVIVTPCPACANASGRERLSTYMICFPSARRPAAVDGASALCRAAARRSAHPKG